MAFNHGIPGLDGFPRNGATPPTNGAPIDGVMAIPNEVPMLSLERLVAESRPSAIQPPQLHQQVPQVPQVQPIHTNGFITPAQHQVPTPHQPVQLTPLADVKQDNKQEVKAEPITEPNTAGGAQESAEVEIEVPSVFIYGGENGEDEFLIPGPRLKQLPKDVLMNLLNEGERMGPYHRLGSTPYWESLNRLKEYLEGGDYRPFKPYTPLEYLNEAGTALQWTKDSPKAVEIPRATYELFLREIEFYLFLAKIGYADLRRISADRMCLRYPKSVHSIWAMVEKLPQVAMQNSDQALMQRLVSYINANIKELVNLPAFMPSLRKLTRGRPPLGPVLLEAYISFSQAEHRELDKIQKEPPHEVSTLIRRASAPVPAPAAMPASAIPTAPRRPDFSSPFDARELPHLIEAILSQNLVVANDNGYGTLVKEGQKTTRNREFEFQKGELLVADREATTVNGRHNIKVMNAQGQVGDILRTLVKKVPPSLGILSPGKHRDQQICPSLVTFAKYRWNQMLLSTPAMPKGFQCHQTESSAPSTHPTATIALALGHRIVDLPKCYRGSHTCLHQGA
jgi:hypothetical protein